MKSWQSYLILILIFALAVPHALAQGTPPFDVDASAAVLLDYDSGQILYSKNGTAERIPASLVKVMTMFVALDQISQGRANLSDTTRVSENAWRMTGSQMFLEVGETVTLEQLLYGIAVVSGNDACVALAEALVSTEVYVQWMNAKARTGTNMTFVDVHGRLKITGSPPKTWLFWPAPTSAHPMPLNIMGTLVLLSAALTEAADPAVQPEWPARNI